MFFQEGELMRLSTISLGFHYAEKEIWLMNTWDERNKAVIEEFRSHGGQVKGWAPLILLTTTGAKTGRPRIAPLMLVTDGDRLLAVASKGGHPEWYFNLLAHPEVTVEVGSEKFETTARILTGDEREQAFKRAVEVFPPYAGYQKKTAREIPVIALERPAK
jgi:deazaflavin-dependent oxidoreductase (nitroreductase family)